METSNELIVVIKESGVEQSTAEMLTQSFIPFFDKAKEWKEKAEKLVVTDVSQTREMKMAREARLALRDVRLDADNKRKSLKEDSIRYGKAVQGVYNVIDFLIAPIEEHLLNQEKFAERIEEKRKAETKQRREEELQPYMEFVPYQIDLGELTEPAWQTLITGAKMQQSAKIEADKKAEEARIEAERIEAEERERMWVENEQLKAEAIEREKKAAAELAEQKRLTEIEKKRQAEELAKSEALRKAAEDKAVKEREQAEAARRAMEEKARLAEIERERLAKIEQQKQADLIAKAEAKVEQERVRAEAERVLAANQAEIARQAAAKALEQERAESARLASELKAKQDAEEAERDRLAKIESDRIAAEKKAEKAPDKDRLIAWVTATSITIPNCSTPEAVVVSETIENKFNAFKAWAKIQIETL